MRFITLVLAAFCAFLSMIYKAEARVRIHVDLASQTMHVASASGDFNWPISSARSGYRTPRGTFGVKRLEAMHYSRKYHNSPMPHSIFFAGGYAIHGTYATGSLGRPASHGCIRIAPENAAVLYQLVKQEGAQIAIEGTVPASRHVYAARDSWRGSVYVRLGGQHPARWDTAGQRTYADPGLPLGYAPVAPGMNQWISDPVGW